MKYNNSIMLELYESLGVSVWKPGGVEMISIHDAFRILEFCDEHNIGVYGIDAFRLKCGSTKPLLKWTRDYSKLEGSALFVAESVSLSIKHIKEIQSNEDDDIYIEFTLRMEDVEKATSKRSVG